MKTVTKEEVERVFKENAAAFVYEGAEKEILNELFPSFKIGDYFVCPERPINPDLRNYGWDKQMDLLVGSVMKVGGFDGDLAIEDEEHEYSWAVEWVRHATPEEIAAAEWEEGKFYRVWIRDEWMVRISACRVGWFYDHGSFAGASTKHDKYEKL